MKSLVQINHASMAVCKLLRSFFAFAALTMALLPSSQSLANPASNTNVVYQGRIVKPDGTPFEESNVQFTLQVYGDSNLLGNGTAGSDRCLLYQETQTVDMSGSSGAFQLYLGRGTSPQYGSGVSSLVVVFRNPQTSSPAASEAIGAISCSSGQTKYLSSAWDNNRELAVTVVTSSTVLNLASMPIQAVPYAQQALQVGGYSSDYLLRVQSSRPGTINNFSADQFDFLLNLGINAVTPGTPATYQVTNLLANEPTLSAQVATKNYVDTKIAAVPSTVASDGVTLQGDGSSGNKLMIKNAGVDTAQLKDASVTSTKLADTSVTTAKLADGNVTMAKINQAGASSGQVLKWNGSAWAPAADSGITTETDPTVSAWAKSANPPAARFVTTGNTLDLAASGVTSGAYGSATQIPILTVDSYGRITAASTAALSTNPTGQTLNSAQIWVGNISNVAAPVTMSGDATLSNSGALSLAASGVTAGTYTQVTVDAKGRVTAAASPSTLSGYGITDAVKNSGGTPSVQEGTFASLPAAGTAGRLYLATDTKLLYRDNGSSWDAIGGAGAVTSVSASAPLQSSGGATPTISFANQNANLILAGPSSGGAAAPTFRSLVAGDLPSAAGDVSGAYGSLSVDKIKGKTVSATAPTSGQVLEYNGSAWVPTTPTVYQSTTLNSAQIWVGNTSNVAAPVTMSGDASLSNAGALTLNTVPVTKGGTGVVSYTIGQIPVYDGTKLTGMTCAFGQSLVSNGPGFGFQCGEPPVTGSSLASGNIWVGNGSALAVPVAPGGDVIMTNAGAFTVTQIQGRAVASTAPTSGQVLTYNGSQWVPTTSPSPTGSGTTNYLAKWTGSNTLGSGLVYDNGTNVGIGTSSPSVLTHIYNNSASNEGLRIERATGTSPSFATFVNGSGRFSFGLEGSTAGNMVTNDSAYSAFIDSNGKDLVLATGNSAKVTIQSLTGNVGIGTTNPGTTLDVSGAIRAANTTDNGTNAIDFSTGNTQYTSANCGSFTMKNLRSGGNYTFIVQGTTAATCSFTMYTDGGTTSISSQKFVPANGPTINTKSTIYNIQVVGTVAYVNWVPGF